MSPPIRLGFGARRLDGVWRPALQEIAFAHKEGFEAIQFHGFERGLGPDILGCSLKEAHTALKANNLSAVMEIVVRINSQGLTREGNRPLQVLEANLHAIAKLNCECVHWHLVPDHYEPDFTNLEDSLYDQFVTAVGFAEREGFKFGFEHNEPAIPLFSSPSSCKKMLDRVEGLGFVWDLNHTIPSDLDQILDLIPRMTMLHISDTPLPEVNHHLPIGKGNIDFSHYFDALAKGGFEGIGILEVGGLPKSGGYGQDTDEALIDSKNKLT